MSIKKLCIIAIKRGDDEDKSEWCLLPESNWRPTDYKSVALPTELSKHINY